MKGIAHAGADGERVDVAHLTGLFERDADEIIFADGDNFDGVGEFVVGGAGVRVCGEEAFGRLSSNKGRKDVLDV